MSTVKIKSTDPKSQGDYVIINESEFDSKKHELFEEEQKAGTFDRAAALEYLKAQGVQTAKNTPIDKLAELVAEAKAEEDRKVAEAEEEAKRLAAQNGSQQ